MRNNIIITIGLSLLLITCHGQPNNSTSIENKNKNHQDCNRNVYGTKKYIEDLPPYICIPPGLIIDDYIRISDLNRDGKNKILAIKYNKKQDDQVDGDLTYWDFYLRNGSDTLYRLEYTLKNIVPPYIKDIGLEYLNTHPLASKIFDEYPRRLDNQKLSFVSSNDTIRLSYKFEDTYGKTFVFVYDNEKKNWHLEIIEYFIGELPKYWWQDNEFYYPLNDNLKIIEKKKPRQRVSIEEFDLKQAFKYRDQEQSHLAHWHIDNLDETAWKSILEVDFKQCQKMDLPDEWKY